MKIFWIKLKYFNMWKIIVNSKPWAQNVNNMFSNVGRYYDVTIWQTCSHCMCYRLGDEISIFKSQIYCLICIYYDYKHFLYFIVWASKKIISVHRLTFIKLIHLYHPFGKTLDLCTSHEFRNLLIKMLKILTWIWK